MLMILNSLNPPFEAFPDFVQWAGRTPAELNTGLTCNLGRKITKNACKYILKEKNNEILSTSRMRKLVNSELFL